EILSLIEELDRRDVILKSLREGVDYSTISGRLVVQVLASVAELERSLISSRTKAALAAKRKKGIVGGRPRIITDEQITLLNKLRKEGLTIRAIAKKTGISPARVHRLLNHK